MAVTTYAQQLEDVQTAIAAVEARGQAVGVNGRSYSRADLKTLYERETWLRRMVDRETRGGIKVARGIPLE